MIVIWCDQPKDEEGSRRPPARVVLGWLNNFIFNGLCFLAVILCIWVLVELPQ